MAKDLYLVRHGKSDHSDGNLSDFDRPLNKRGENDSPKMGAIVGRMGFKPELIVTSPAERAKKTAELFAEQLHYPLDKIQYKEEIYEAQVRTLLNTISNFQDQYDKVMMIGHNPGFTYLVEYLTGDDLENIPTAGFVHIRFSTDSWQNVTAKSGDLMLFEYPKKHNAK